MVWTYKFGRFLTYIAGMAVADMSLDFEKLSSLFYGFKQFVFIGLFDLRK